MNRRARRAAAKVQSKNVDAAVERAQARIVEANGAVARYRDMFSLAQQALQLAAQAPVVPLPEGHDSADGDPNRVREFNISEAQARVEASRALYFAATLDFYDLLASVDGEPDPLNEELPR